MTICRCGLAHTYHAERFHLADHEYVPRYPAQPDPDPLTVYPEPDTDDEPWRVPGPDPDARRWWALAIAAVVLFVVAVAWWR